MEENEVVFNQIPYISTELLVFTVYKCVFGVDDISDDINHEYKRRAQVKMKENETDGETEREGKKQN